MLPYQVIVPSALPEDLLNRLETITKEVESLRAAQSQLPEPASAAQLTALESKVGELRGHLDKHLVEAGGQFSEVFRQITNTNNQVIIRF